MFSGIVEDIGVLQALEEKDKGVVLRVGVRKIDAGELVLGESVAVNGVCLTVVSVEDGSFSVDASHETLSRTNLSGLRAGSGVNLERSLRVGDRMGGHIVTGHVDGVGAVQSIAPVGESRVFSFSIPTALAKYVVEKGSVAVDGVSLTVNSVRGAEFSVNIIPYTLRETTFSEFRRGREVNIECDIIGKYVEKMLSGADTPAEGSSVGRKL
ncbi:MAG: riboflavin synthase [Candidatus Dadabacteria bacterium]|nr:riboflavin synthase [Candidatus Dadabacteria bacterium]MYA48659.1 riboflavin synthase [Candidatus Dadabacteria bacterium]MYF48017.1 riboflavin synthase [Candidatus Dadabacteria bacterium]MYG82898.1 riboflavin synthase [Candidatus Dadabacteria bacterium]MYK48712.1 riboflavin synthase [Candidatus Dadabacteria bacterium]